MEPWCGLGYTAPTLGRYLARKAKIGQVRTIEIAGITVAMMVLQPEFLLGSFIALLAVRSDAAGKGLGRALVEWAKQETFKKRKWLFVSSDRTNLPAGRFYKKLGFERVALLPDLVCQGHTEILWRMARKSPG
jgi:ribosomal protein S18 acetylase RimI-like enzyme